MSITCVANNLTCSSEDSRSRTLTPCKQNEQARRFLAGFVDGYHHDSVLIVTSYPESAQEGLPWQENISVPVKLRIATFELEGGKLISEMNCDDLVGVILNHYGVSVPDTAM